MYINTQNSILWVNTSAMLSLNKVKQESGIWKEMMRLRRQELHHEKNGWYCSVWILWDFGANGFLNGFDDGEWFLFSMAEHGRTPSWIVTLI